MFDVYMWVGEGNVLGSVVHIWSVDHHLLLHSRLLDHSWLLDNTRLLDHSWLVDDQWWSVDNQGLFDDWSLNNGWFCWSHLRRCLRWRTNRSNLRLLVKDGTVPVDGVVRILSGQNQRSRVRLTLQQS